MEKRKPTVGEREVCKYTGLLLAQVQRNSASAKLARRIDRAVRRESRQAFKDGITAMGLHFCNDAKSQEIRSKLIAKYGVKP